MPRLTFKHDGNLCVSDGETVLFTLTSGDATFQQAQAEIQVQQAAVKTAQTNLGYTKVTAPIAGRIGKSNVTEGALVTALREVKVERYALATRLRKMEKRAEKVEAERDRYIGALEWYASHVYMGKRAQEALK